MMNESTNTANIMQVQRPLKGDSRNVSDRKLPTVESASFDTLILALTKKSEKAQCTFVFRYLAEAPGEVLAMMNKYSGDEIMRRARANITKG